jgi:hypothetical protein
MVLGLLLFAWSAYGQKVEVKFDKSADFSKYKTYFWVKGMPAKNPIINQMITDAVEQQLSAKGLAKTDAGGDLQIMFAAATDIDLQIPGVTWSSVSNPMATYAQIGPPMNIHTGTLVVDISDAKTERYLWRGIARQTLTQGPTGNITKDAQSVDKLVKKATAKMFNKYPPK